MYSCDDFCIVVIFVLGLLGECTTSCFSINCSTVRGRLGLGLVLVLICRIMTANGLSYVVNIDYTNTMRCTFQGAPDDSHNV